MSITHSYQKNPHKVERMAAKFIRDERGWIQIAIAQMELVFNDF